MWFRNNDLEKKNTIILLMITVFFITSCSHAIEPEKKNNPPPTDIDDAYLKRHSDSLMRAKQLQIEEDEQKRWFFFSDGYFHHLVQWETGRRFPFRDGKPLCHYDKNDKGSFTCVGVAYTANKEWYSKLLGRTKPTVRVLNKLFREEYARRSLSDWYWSNYVELFYRECGGKAAFYIGDLAITSGPRNAIEIFQRSHGLKQDGLWGAKSRAACQSGTFNSRAFLLEEKLRYIRLSKRPNQKKFLKGWLKRTNSKKTFYPTTTRELFKFI